MNPWCTSSGVTPHVSSSCRLWPARRQAGPRAHLVYEPVVHQLGSHAARQQQLPALASTEAGGARALTSCMNPWCTSSGVTPHVSSSCRLWPARRQAGPARSPPRESRRTSAAAAGSGQHGGRRGPRAHLVYEPVVHQLGSHAARQQQLPALASTEAGGARALTSCMNPWVHQLGSHAARQQQLPALASTEAGGARALTSCMNPWCTSSGVTPHVSSSCRLWPARRQAGPARSPRV
ncbi:hypothetical protein ACJJTC_015649 [Scirpophaga incertulas]